MTVGRNTKSVREDPVTEMSQIEDALGYVLNTSKVDPQAVLQEFRPQFETYLFDVSREGNVVWEVRRDLQSIFTEEQRDPRHYTTAAQTHLLPIMDQLVEIVRPESMRR